LQREFAVGGGHVIDIGFFHFAACMIEKFELIAV
jgi:hypothetical protein